MDYAYPALGEFRSEKNLARAPVEYLLTCQRIATFTFSLRVEVRARKCARTPNFLSFKSAIKNLCAIFSFAKVQKLTI